MTRLVRTMWNRTRPGDRGLGSAAHAPDLRAGPSQCTAGPSPRNRPDLTRIPIFVHDPSHTRRQRMGPIDALWHVLNFVAPAAFTAASLAAWAAVLDKKYRKPSVVRSLFAIFFAVGAAVLTAGLILLGHDGRMLTYAALVLAQGSASAFLWRR